MTLARVEAGCLCREVWIPHTALQDQLTGPGLQHIPRVRRSLTKEKANQPFGRRQLPQAKKGHSSLRPVQRKNDFIYINVNTSNAYFLTLVWLLQRLRQAAYFLKHNCYADNSSVIAFVLNVKVKRNIYFKTDKRKLHCLQQTHHTHTHTLVKGFWTIRF